MAETIAEEGEKENKQEQEEDDDFDMPFTGGSVLFILKIPLVNVWNLVYFAKTEERTSFYLWGKVQYFSDWEKKLLEGSGEWTKWVAKGNPAEGSSHSESGLDEE